MDQRSARQRHRAAVMSTAVRRHGPKAHELSPFLGDDATCALTASSLDRHPGSPSSPWGVGGTGSEASRCPDCVRFLHLIGCQCLNSSRVSALLRSYRSTQPFGSLPDSTGRDGVCLAP
jgi:hypothetical protein